MDSIAHALVTRDDIVLMEPRRTVLIEIKLVSVFVKKAAAIYIECKMRCYTQFSTIAAALLCLTILSRLRVTAAYSGFDLNSG